MAAPVPRCPKCGEPARVEVCLAEVRRDVWTKRLITGKSGPAVGPVTYECGGGHRWKGEPANEG